MKWRGFTIVELLIVILIIALLMFAAPKCVRWAKSRVFVLICGKNIEELGISLRQYASDHQGQYPPPDKWCDMLYEKNNRVIPPLVCKVARTDTVYRSDNPNEPDPNLIFRRVSSNTNEPNKYIYVIKVSTYALNPNATGKSSKDVVLLFESTPGWNQSGTEEILQTWDHGTGEGCNVLFNNGSVKFIKANKIKNLKWKD